MYYILYYAIQGRCYIWTLTGGRSGDPTQPHVKADYSVSSRYALKCLFSPDSTYVLYANLGTVLLSHLSKI